MTYDPRVHRDKYLGLAHQIQTAIAAELEVDPSSGTPKHLRVGVNMAMCDIAALVDLMIEKGVCTQQEFSDKQLYYMAKERDRCVGEFRNKAGVPPETKVTVY